MSKATNGDSAKPVDKQSPMLGYFLIPAMLVAFSLKTPAQAQPPFAFKTDTDYKAYRDVRYGPHDERNVYDLFVPENTSKPVPLVIWIHGGGWANGSKNSPQAMRLIDQGFAVASLNYRLSRHAIFPAQIHDCKAAVRHLRAHAKEYNLDSNRFGVWGASAGGHLSALVGTAGNEPQLEGDVGDCDDVSSRVQAVCDWFGPTDFLQMGGHHNNFDSPESRLIGGPIRDQPDKVQAANPMTYVDRNDPPILIMHGDQDPLVPFEQSLIFEAKLRQAGVDVELVKIEGAGHGGRGFDSPQVREQIVAFFKKHLN